MCENKDDGVLAWHANEPRATWVEYAHQLKKYLLEDTTKRVFVYGKENEVVEYKRVTHGHWLKRMSVGGFAEKWEYKCSICECIEEDLNHLNFCPNCGNPLDEGDK